MKRERSERHRLADFATRNAMTELKYTKDGVPIYDGSPETFTAYKRTALIYSETVDWKKKMLVGPRLQAALEGSARMAVEHMPPSWVTNERGAARLLNFHGVKRRRGEGMDTWIVRHDEALLEAKRTAGHRIQPRQPTGKDPSGQALAESEPRDGIKGAPIPQRLRA